MLISGLDQFVEQILPLDRVGDGGQFLAEPQPNGALVNPQSGKCLTDTGSGGSGTQAAIDDCTGGTNQRWTLP